MDLLDDVVTVKFITPNGSEGFNTLGYQRNNKTGGQKHLRCFPQCNAVHNNTGFCGSSVIVELKYNPLEYSSGSFFAFGCFRSAEDPMEPASISLAKIKSFTNSIEAPLNPWYLGKICKSNSLPNSGGVKFEFNGEKRGWHYGWFATKSTRELYHNFKVYIFYSPTTTTNENFILQNIGSCTSIPFQLCCTKRAAASKPNPQQKKRKSTADLSSDDSTSTVSDEITIDDILLGNNNNIASAFKTTKPKTNFGGSPSIRFTPSQIPPPLIGFRNIGDEESVVNNNNNNNKRSRLSVLDETPRSLYTDDSSDATSDGPLVAGGSPNRSSPETVSSPSSNYDDIPVNFIGDDTILVDLIVDEPNHNFNFNTPNEQNLTVPVDMSTIWREDEIVGGEPRSKVALVDHHDLHVPSDFQWERDAVSSTGFYFNTGVSTTSTTGFPSAPSMDKLSTQTKRNVSSDNEGFFAKLYNYFSTNDSRNRGTSTSSENFSTIAPFSSPSLIRPVRSGIACPTTLSYTRSNGVSAYPVAPDSVFESLLRSDGKNLKPFAPSSKKRANSSISNSAANGFLSPLKFLLLILSVAVGYLVVDKLQSQPGNSSSSSHDGNSSVMTPTIDSGSTLRTTIAVQSEAPTIYLDGYIPSWLLVEFSSPECQCGSFATLQNYCKTHVCSQSMLDSTITLTPSDVLSSQYDLAKWVLTNKQCLSESCSKTGNANICSLTQQPLPSSVNQTAISSSPPQWSSNYCLSVHWSSYYTLVQPYVLIPTTNPKSLR